MVGCCRGLADGRLQRIHVEAGVGAGVAGGPELLDLDQQGIAVAVERRPAHVLAVSAGVALAPVLLPAARPEGHPALGEGAAQRLGVHVAEHQHLAGVVLLDDRGQQPVRRRRPHAAPTDRLDLASLIARSPLRTAARP